MDAEPDELSALAQAQIQAHEHLAPQIAAEQHAHIVGLLERFEADVAPLIRPYARKMLDEHDIPAELRPLLEMAANPEHFGESVVIGIFIGSILSPLIGAVVQPELQDTSIKAWTLNPTRPVTPDVAVEAVLKGVIDQPTGEAEAVKSGYGKAQFDQMVQAAGQSIGLELALLLLRRGQITEAMFRQIIQYSNINPKFYGVPELAKFVPPTVGEVMTGWLKQKLDTPTAQKYISFAGIDPAEHFGWLSESTGRPLTWHEMYTAIHRGYPGPITAEESLAESDIHPRYQGVIPYLQHNYPPLFQLMRLLHAGTITPQRAATILKYEGYEQTEIDAIVASGGSTSTTVKDLTVSQVERMYTTRLIDKPTAVTKLTAAKYSPADIDLLLTFADDQRHERVLDATINKVGTLYVAHRINLTDATKALNDAGVPVLAQHDLFRLWDIQRTATAHVPTPAMVVAAGRRQEISPQEVKLRLNQLGIADADLAIFVADGYPPTHPLEGQAAAAAVVQNLSAWPAAAGGPATPPKRLTTAQIAQLYSAGTIGTQETINDLIAIGYSPTTAAQLVTTFNKPAVPKP